MGALHVFVSFCLLQAAVASNAVKTEDGTEAERAALEALDDIHSQIDVRGTRKSPAVDGNEDPEDVAKYMAQVAPFPEIVMEHDDPGELEAALHMFGEHCKHTAKADAFSCFRKLVNQADELGQTALYQAMQYKRALPVVQLLLSAGADPSATTLNGNRVYDVVNGDADTFNAVKDAEKLMLRTGKVQSQWWHSQYGDGETITAYTPDTIEQGGVLGGDQWTYKDEADKHAEAIMRAELGNHVVDAMLAHNKKDEL